MRGQSSGGLMRPLVSQSSSRCARALCSISRVSDMTLSPCAVASHMTTVFTRSGGSVIQVMLCSRTCGMVSQNTYGDQGGNRALWS